MAITIFLCYAPQDESLLQKLKAHLRVFEHQGHITLWDRGGIQPGAVWEQEVRKHLDEAQIILLLLSSSFMASYYQYTMEVRYAVVRHERQEARVIPILLRPVLWQIPPLDKLQALPDSQKALTSWRLRDEGFVNVASGIGKVLAQLQTQNLPGPRAERKQFMDGINTLIAAVEANLQPAGRARNIAQTLQQLNNLTPIDVTLADLVIGWRTLAQPLQEGEEIAIAQRRITCGELARLATPLIDEQGSVVGTLKAWQSWRDVFTNSNDPRRDTMAQTFAREAKELQMTL